MESGLEIQWQLAIVFSFDKKVNKKFWLVQKFQVPVLEIRGTQLIYNQGCNKSLPLCFNTWSFKLFWKEELNLEASWLGLTEGDWPKLQFSFSLWFIPSIFSDTSKTEEGLLRWKNSTWLWRALGWENDFLQDAQANGFSILESIFWWVHFEVFWITECFVNKTNLYFVNKVKLLRDATD